MKKIKNFHFGYFQYAVFLITFCLFMTSCLRQTKNQDVLKISTQTKKQNSKKINQVSKKSASKKMDLKVIKNDTMLLNNEEIVVANQEDRETQLALDSTKVTNTDYTDSMEIENYFTELEKVEVDSSDFVLIKDY